MTTENNTESAPHDTVEVKNPAAVLAKNKELLAALSAANARIAELEAQAAQFTADHDALKAEFDTFHIRRPLTRLAEEISPIPDVWRGEFLNHFDVKAVGDDLGIFTKDGERCVIPKGYVGAGEPVKFDARAVWGMLATYVEDANAPNVKRWKAMMNYFGPQGSGARGSTGAVRPPSAPEMPKGATSNGTPALGLR